MLLKNQSQTLFYVSLTLVQKNINCLAKLDLNGAPFPQFFTQVLELKFPEVVAENIFTSYTENISRHGLGMILGNTYVILVSRH